MSDQKERKELPTMEDFEESSLLDAIVEEEEAPPKEDPPEKEEEPQEKPEAKEEKKEPEQKEEKEEKEEIELSSEKEEKEEKEEPSEDEGTFWTDVERLTGRQVEVDYEGVDPESPEGAARREEALVQSAINDHLDYLQKMFPKEFRALEYAADGGSIDDLYTPGEPDYSKMEIPEEDEEFQKNFMQGFYEKKGFSRQRAKRMVEADQDSEEGLFESTKSALKELAVVQEKAQQQKIATQKQEADRNKREDLQMIGAVEQVVQTGKLNRFTVPTKEREDFYRFSLSHIQRNPQGGYMFVMPLEQQRLEQQLQDMYFTYKRGDLKSIIQREAKNESARRLRRNIGKQKKDSSQEDQDRERRGLPTMEDYEG